MLINSSLFRPQGLNQSKIKEDFEVTLEGIKKAGLYPNIPIVASAATEPRININGETYFLFSSNNYLGMSSHSEIKEAMVKAANKYGMGSGGPRLLAGNLDLHNQLEQEVAQYLGREDCVIFTTGYMANIGLIPALVNSPFPLTFNGYAKNFVSNNFRKTVIFSDEFNHGSIIDGIRLAGAEKVIYKHLDYKDLDQKVNKFKHFDKKIIITDGVFSMEGDIAPLKEIVDISKQNDCLLMVDDAHSIGVLGQHGRGLVDYFHLTTSDVPILLGTFTKAFGGIGGFVVGRKTLIDYLRIAARTYILSAPIPPSITAGLIRSVQIVRNADKLRRKAFENANYFKSGVQNIGYTITNTQSLIVPVIIGDEKLAILFTDELFKRKIYVPNARFPAVPMGKSRLRFVFSSLHEKDDIDYLINQLKSLRYLLN